MFKALQWINMEGLIYNPDLVLDTGEVFDVIKLKAQWQGCITLPDGILLKQTNTFLKVS